MGAVSQLIFYCNVLLLSSAGYGYWYSSEFFGGRKTVQMFAVISSFITGEMMIHVY
jgi:hypothetical protein